MKSKTAELTPSEDGLEELLPGTQLRDRYVINKQLGQGGFGRTYLAKDTGRFHEKVAIKEFVLSVQGTHALQKAEELFQRKAITLHQLQIPKFLDFGKRFGRGNDSF